MSLIFADGFDWYRTADGIKRWTYFGSGSVGISAAVGRAPTGQGISVPQSNNGQVYKQFGVDYVQGIVGFAMYSPGAVANRNIFTILDGTSEQISVRTNGSSVPIVSRAGTTLATGTTVLSTSTWYYVELKFTINNTTGVVELKLNGASEIASTSSLNTRATANTRWNGVQLSANNQATMNFDDIYVLDSAASPNDTFLGPVQVVARYPDGNGNHADWTPNGGSNMGAVSETFEDGDVTFNASATANDIDTFTMQDLPVASGTVAAVQQHTVAAQEGGAARTIAALFRIGSTDYVGASVGLSTSYQFLTQVWDVSPATSTAWTVSEVNGAESGYKLIS